MHTICVPFAKSEVRSIDPRCAMTTPKWTDILHDPSIWIYAHTFESENLQALKTKMDQQVGFKPMMSLYNFPVPDAWLQR